MKDRTGMLAMILVAFIAGLLGSIAAQQRADAAALAPPAGWYPNRANMNYAMGRVYASVGTAVGTTEITITGMLATDYLCGIANLSDPTETQIALSAATAASGKVSFASGSTNGEKYLVIYKRARPEYSD